MSVSPSSAPLLVADRYFQALTSGDLSQAVELLSPEVLWFQPGTNRFSGRYKGREDVVAMLSSMMEASEGTFRIMVTGPLMVNDEQVLVPVRFSGRRQGAHMDMEGADLLTVREGLIAEVRLFSADGEAEDRFFGRR